MEPRSTNNPSSPPSPRSPDLDGGPARYPGAASSAGPDPATSSPEAPFGTRRPATSTAPTEPKSAASFGATAADFSAMMQDRLEHAKRYVFEMAEYVGYLVRTRVDRAVLALRTFLIGLSVFVVLTISVVSAIVYGTVLLLHGIAEGLGQLFGRPWLGSIVTGVLVVGLGVVVVLAVGARMVHNRRIALHAKYEARKAAQREQFGRDVTDAAAGRPASHP